MLGVGGASEVQESHCIVKNRLCFRNRHLMITRYSLNYIWIAIGKNLAQRRCARTDGYIPLDLFSVHYLTKESLA